MVNGKRKRGEADHSFEKNCQDEQEKGIFSLKLNLIFIFVFTNILGPRGCVQKSGQDVQGTRIGEPD